MFQNQVLKSSELSKKQAKKCKFIKSRQLARQLHLSRFKKAAQARVLNSLSVEI